MPYTKTIEKTVYTFEDVKNDIDGIKDKVLSKLWDINVAHDWWEFIYEDAKQVDLKITGFDTGRGNYCNIEFIYTAEDTAKAIIENHGESCDTYIAAKEFLDEFEKVSSGYNEIDEPTYGDDVEFEGSIECLEDEFINTLGECYLSMFRNEYDYLTSEEVILESIEVNGYEFDVFGVIV